MKFTMTATIISPLNLYNEEINFVNETETFIFSQNIYWSFKIKKLNMNVSDFFKFKT